MQSHFHCLCACDFFNVEVLGVFGAVRCSVFFVIRIETREHSECPPICGDFLCDAAETAVNCPGECAAGS